ncbi:UNVERIFIED_CONTAM: hypothetical protein PYX00_011922 [Menopon gallinae]|uniref:Elongation factor G 2 n=1 Tax=Menopon gallinae TaxID=328185 RepID=A0AAW2H8R1_9NEOP
MEKRNIGIMAHVDAGKTTTTERILYYTGKTHRLGNVDTGNAIMDWMPQEQERGITITAAATTCEWRDVQINIIDTPGHVDFTAEVECSLRVLDAAIAIFSAVDGVEPQSETVWYQADKYGVSRLIFINKMDRVGADFSFVVKDIQEKLGVKPVILHLPIIKQDHFEGIIDVLNAEEVYWNEADEGLTYVRKELSASFKKQTQQAYEQVLDLLTQNNDQIMEMVLEGQEIPISLLKKVIREQTIAGLVVPLFLGASLRNIGVQCLLDAVVDYLPAPEDMPGTISRNFKGEEHLLSFKKDEPLIAFVFKVQHDAQMGSLCFVRIYQGSLKKGNRLFNPLKNKKEKVARIFRLHANRNEAIDEASVGDIVGILGMKFTQTGDTLCAEEVSLLLGDLVFPQPVISQSIESKVSTDQEKLEETLLIIAKENPTFAYKEDAETGQLLIYGMGELQLDVIVRRIQEEFAIPISVSQPQVSYREKPEQATQLNFEFNGMFASKMHTATLSLALLPQETNQANAVEITKELEENPLLNCECQNALKKGAFNALSSGVIMGYPIIETKIILKSFLCEETSLPSTAFLEMLASLATSQVLRNSLPKKAQPIMKVEVRTPSDYRGEVVNQLIMKGGSVQTCESRGTQEIIVASVPLIELFGYSTQLRSVSKGKTVISENNIEEALEDIKVQLLEADVNIRAVRRLLAGIREEALGKKVLSSLSPYEQFVKIVHDKLVDLLGQEENKLQLKSPKHLSVILMLGLQGCGKTTSSAKLAHYLKKKGRQPLLVACDLIRPAAKEQLKILAQQIQVPIYAPEELKDVLSIAKEAEQFAKKHKCDTLIVDTAGRLELDEPLIKELVQLKNWLKPDESLLVLDAMMGQNAVAVASTFEQELGFSGVLISKADSDVRGGLILSLKVMTAQVESTKSFVQDCESSIWHIDHKKEDLVQDLHNRIDAMIDSSLGVVKSRLESYEKFMEGSYGQYEGKFQNLQVHYEQKLNMVLGEVGKLSQEVLNEASSLIEKKVHIQSEQLHTQFNSNLQELEKKQLSRLEALAKEIQVKVSSVEALQSNLLEDFQERVRTQLDLNQQRIDVQVQSFSKKIESSQQYLDARLGEITSIADNEKEYYQHQAREYYEKTTEELKEKLNELSYQIKDELETLEFRLASESKSLRDSFEFDKANYTSLKEELKNEWQELLNYVEGTSQELKDSLADQSQKSQQVGEELFSRLEEHFKKEGLSLHKKWHSHSVEVEKSMQDFWQRTQKVVQDYQERIDSFENNLSEQLNNLESHLGEVHTHSQSRLSHFMDSFENSLNIRLEEVRSGLDEETKKFEEWIFSLETRLDDKTQSCQRVLSTLEQEAQEKLDIIKDYLLSEFGVWQTQLEEAHKLLKSSILSSNQELDGVQSELNTKMQIFKKQYQDHEDNLLNKMEELRNQSEHYARELFGELANTFDRKIRDLDKELSSQFNQAVHQSNELVGSLNLIILEKQKEVNTFKDDWQKALDIMREKFESVQINWGQTYEQVLSQGRRMGEDLSSKLLCDLDEAFRTSEKELLLRFQESQKSCELRIHELEQILTGIDKEVGLFQANIGAEMQEWQGQFKEEVYAWQHDLEAGQKDLLSNHETLKANFQDLKGSWQHQVSSLEGDFNRRIRELDNFYKEQVEVLRKGLDGRYNSILEDSHAQATLARQNIMELIHKQESELSEHLSKVQEDLLVVSKTSSLVSEEGEKVQQKLVSEIMELNGRIDSFAVDIRSQVAHLADSVRSDIVGDVDSKIEEFDKGIRYRFERLHALEDEAVSLELNLKLAIDNISTRLDAQFGETLQTNQKRLEGFHTEISAIEQSLEQLKSNSYSNVSDYLKVFEDEFFQGIKERSERLDATLSNWQGALERAWEDKLKERMSEIHSTIDEQTQSVQDNYLILLKEKIENLRLEGRSYFEQVQSGFAEFEKDFYKRFEETRLSLENSQEQVHQRQEELENSQTHFREQILRSSQEGQALLDNLLSTSREKIAQQVRFIEDKISTRLNDFSCVLDVKQKGMEDWLSSVKHDVRYWQEEVFSKIKEDAENLKVDNKTLSFRLQETASAFSDFKRDMETGLKNVNERLNFQFEESSAELDKRLGQLKTRLETLGETLEQDQEKLKELFNREMASFGSEVDKLLSLRKADIDKQYLSLSKELEARSLKLYEGFEKQYLANLKQGLADQDKLQKDLLGLSRNMENIKHVLDEKVLQAKSLIETDFQNVEKEMRTQLNTLKEEIKGRLSESETKMRDFDATFEDYQLLIRSKLKDSYDALIGRIEQDWDSLTAQIEEKAQTVELALKQKLTHIQGLEDNWEEKVKKNYQKLFAEIHSVRSFHKELDEMQPLGEKIRVLRQDYLSAVKGMEEELHSLNSYKQTISNIKRETGEAKNLSQDVLNSFESVIKEKDQIYQLKDETLRMLEVSRDIEERLERITRDYKSLDEIQRKILHLADLDSKLEERFSQYENQKLSLDDSMQTLSQSQLLAQELEHKIQALSHDLAKLPVEVEELKEHYKILSSHEDSAHKTMEMVERMGELIASLEERAEKTQASLKWLGNAETRLEKISRDTQEQIRLLGLLIKDDSRLVRKDQIPNESVRQNVLKLARQGWSKEEIARATKISLGEVELIMELGIMPVED